MASSLECLPTETFAGVLAHVDHADIYNLRLASHKLCHLATQDTFRHLCKVTRVRITPEGLQRFVESTRNGFLSSSLTALTLVYPARRFTVTSLRGPVPTYMSEWMMTTSDWSKMARDTSPVFRHLAAMLTEAFNNIQVHARNPLTLKIKIVRNVDVQSDQRQPSFEAGSWIIEPAFKYVFRLVTSSLRSSQLRINNMGDLVRQDEACEWDDITMHSTGNTIRV